MFLLGTVFTASYYFPIYFQAVKGDGPTMSGVDLLPSIFSQLLLTVLSGWLSKSYFARHLNLAQTSLLLTC